MKKLALLCAFACCFSVCAISGCGGGGTEVIAVPEDAGEEQTAMEGMSDEEYNKAMEESMKQQ
ncbi:hypothetical protein [Planctomycetes bacterium K23_9]|uniref:Secreted protein n=1 Tax=Stieleria marina TaxID=1930275 RepID=A0A517NSQ8_9BACT|nr:hypothetical protein K239x_20910 [Planctomycetes bacterium K23_9]